MMKKSRIFGLGLALLIGVIIWLFAFPKQLGDSWGDNQVLSEKTKQGSQLLTYSNLLDPESQAEVTEALGNAGVSEERVQALLQKVKLFNESVENVSLKSGFLTTQSVEGDYDHTLLQEKRDAKNPDFIGYNCRITSYDVMRDFVQVSKPSFEGTEELIFDQEAIASSPMELFNETEKEQFLSLFAVVPTANTSDLDTHLTTLKSAWAQRGITFLKKNDQSPSLISVVMHSVITPEESHLFVGHIGVLIPREKDLLFLEKLAFQEPYQVFKFQDRKELNAYLMAKYDVEFDQSNARPFIMENGDLMEGFAYLRI